MSRTFTQQYGELLPHDRAGTGEGEGAPGWDQGFFAKEVCHEI